METGGVKSRRRIRWLSLDALLLCGAMTCAGCVERILQVRADPPGSTVHINGVEVGTTPVDYEFTFYGTFDVTVRHEDYFSQRKLVSVRPPWYQQFPIDFFSEVLNPWTIRDVHEVEMRLTPAPEDVTMKDQEALRARAARLQEDVGEIQERARDRHGRND